ncbi:unnamed protein product, partial [Musa banksii]
FYLYLAKQKTLRKRGFVAGIKNMHCARRQAIPYVSENIYIQTPASLPCYEYYTLRLRAALTSSLHAQPPPSSLHTSHGAARDGGPFGRSACLTRTLHVNARHVLAAGTSPRVTSLTLTSSSSSSSTPPAAEEEPLPSPSTILRYASLVQVTPPHSSDTNPGHSSAASAALATLSFFHETSPSLHVSVTHSTVTQDTTARTGRGATTTSAASPSPSPIHAGATAAGVGHHFGGAPAGSPFLSGVSGISGRVTMVDEENDFPSSTIGGGSGVASTFLGFLPLAAAAEMAGPFRFGLLAPADASLGAAATTVGEPTTGLGAMGRNLSMIRSTFQATLASPPPPYIAIQQPPLLSIPFLRLFLYYYFLITSISDRLAKEGLK